jgi:hypothetical protein
MRIATDVRDVLERATVDGRRLRLPEQLPDHLYQRVHKVLTAAGGRWTRSVQAHVFTSDPSALINGIVRTGVLMTPQDDGYFPTPPPVVERLMEPTSPPACASWSRPPAGARSPPPSRTGAASSTASNCCPTTRRP